MISARKAKQLDATTIFPYSHANTALGQSERACYLSYFIKLLTTQGRRRLEWTISCTSLYFVHPSLELVPLVAFECRLRGSNFPELISIWRYYFVYKNTCNKIARSYGWLWILCNSVIVWQLSMPQNEIIFKRRAYYPYCYAVSFGFSTSSITDFRVAQGSKRG